MGPYPQTSADSYDDQYRPMGPFYGPDAEAPEPQAEAGAFDEQGRPMGPLYGPEGDTGEFGPDHGGPAPLKTLKQEAAKRRPVARQAGSAGGWHPSTGKPSAGKPAGTPKIVLPKGYKLDEPGNQASPSRPIKDAPYLHAVPMQHIPAGEAKPAPGAATGPASRNEQRIQNVKKEWDDLWDKRARELAAFAHTFGVGKEEFQAKAKELQEHPLTEALKDSLPGVGMARGLYQEGKRSLGEVDEADRALRTQGQPIGERLEAAAYHGAKATPIVGRLLDVAEDAYTKAGGQPVSVAEDFTDPKKYWKNINIAATSPEVRGTTEGAAVQLAQLLDGFNSLGKAYAARQAARPEILPPEPQYVNPKQSGLPPGGGPTTIEGRMSGEPPAARPGAHPEAENLTPKEQKVHNAIEGRVVHHAKAEAEVRRDLEEIAPEDRQAVLEEIGQRGLEAYRRGDMDAATEAVQHAHILKQIMAEEEAAVLEAAAAAPARPPAVVPPAPTPAAAAKPVSEAAPEVAKPAAKPAARPVATAEPETQMPLFYPPEPAAPLVPQGAAAEAPQTVGSLAKEIGETMTRQEMLDELGIRKGAGDPRGRAATSRLALLLAVNRLSASKPLAAAPAAAPPAPPAPQEAAPEATPEAAATAPKKKVAKKQTWADVAKDHYTPGNVVFNDYWNNYDKVLDFKPGEANGTGWAVQVIHSDKDGHPLPGEQPRWHSTYPDPKRDKVVIRAPEPAPAPEPEAAVTPKAAPAGAEAEPGVVGKAAERIGKRKREKPEPVAAGAPATTEPPPTTPAPPAVMPQEPTPPAPTVAAAPEAEVEHSAADKAWEATAPEGYVGADGETTMIAAHGAGKEFKTKAQAKKAIDKWKAGLIPADQYRAQAPEAPPAAPAAAPAPAATPAPAKPPKAAPEPVPKPAAAAPAAAPAAGPLNFKRVAGAATPTWRAEGTNYTVRLTGDGYDTYSGDKFLGNTKSLDDAKANAQQDMPAATETAQAALPKAPPLPPKPEGSQGIQLSWAEAVIRGLEKNADLATAEKSTRHDTPVIATNDDAMVLLDRLSKRPPRSNAMALASQRADELIALMREYVKKDPEGRQGLAALADAMESHRTPHGNVILHRHVLSDAEINRIALEELFHDWQMKHLTPNTQNVFAISGAMRSTPSANAWSTVIGNLGKSYAYTGLTATIEAPAWVASGDYEHLGINSAEAVKLLGDYLEQASKLFGREAVDTLPPIAKSIEGRVHDEIRRRNLGRHGESNAGGRGGRIDTLEPPGAELSKETPGSNRAKSGAGKKAAAPGKIAGAQSLQPPEERGPAPLETVLAEAKEKDPHEDWLRAGVQRYAERRRSPVHEAPEGTRDERAKDIADAYAALKHEPDNPQVKASYDALKRDLDEQWDHAEELGVQFEPWSGTGQPYKDSAEMAADVRNNHHLFFFRGGDMPADHPLAEVDPATGYTYNEKLRAVHDLFGHAERGWKFGERGEENAWISHSQMFSREALPALTTETKGQNNWVNFGPHMRGPDGTLIKKGDEGWLPRPDRPFAEQKAGLLPKRYHYRIDAPLSFISPNTMDIPSVTEAQRQFKSDIHQQFIGQAHQLADDMGMNVVIESALGSWQGGAENSIAVHYPFGIDPDLPKYFEATLGRLGHQFATARFTPDASGKDTAHFLWIDSNKTTTKELAQVLLSNGIENSTITPEEGGYGVTLIDANDALQENIKQAKKELGVKGGGHNRGTAAFPGDYSDREAAGRGFLETNEEIESRRPSLRGVRRDFESRPDYHLLHRAIREAQELVPEPDEGIGTLQSRQRTPKTGAIDDVRAEAERLNPHGSSVPIMESVLLPNYKSVGDIGTYLEDNTRQTLKQLHPGTTPREKRSMVDRAVRIARDELKYQLAQENSGVNWYTEDIRGKDGSLMSEMRKLHPELKDPAKERVFLLATAITSPGKTAAFDNINVAEQAYSLYKKSGELPLKQPDGTPWGSYGNAPIKTARALLRHFGGDEAKAMAWMLAKHSIEELRQVKEKSGFSADTVNNALPPDHDADEVYGAYILGPKVGPFFLNLNGISTELTVDRWYMRTWNRLMGTLVDEDGVIQDVPRGKNERAAMIEATRKLEEEFGLETSQVQAALWYYEQGLYSRLGKRGKFGGTYANAAKSVHDLRSRGHASLGAENAWKWDDAEREQTRGSTGAYPRRARGKNTESEGEGPQGDLFGFDFGAGSSDPGESERGPIDIGEAKAELERRNPRRQQKRAASR